MKKNATQTRKFGATGLAVLTASLMVVSSHAASVTFQNSVVITDTSALDAILVAYPTATLQQAVNFSSGAQSVTTVGGQTINFANGSTDNNGPSGPGTTTTLFQVWTQTDPTLCTVDTGSAAFNTILQGQGWCNSGSSASPETLRIGGLTTGITYEAELLASDMRSGSAGRTQSYNDVANYTGNASDSFSVQSPTYVLATFTADANGYQDIFIQDTVGSGWDSTFAGFTLYAVPEPSTCAMVAGGLGMLLAGFRMRKNK
jgi:hypothetical protein